MAKQIPPAPPERVHAVRDAMESRPDGQFVLYWMIAHRRRRFHFGLQHAVHHAVRWNKPLVVLEALRSGYRWASDRLHRFILQGMADNREAFADSAAVYYPYVETREGEGKGLLETLARRACLIVTDDFPCFFLPAMVRKAASAADVRIEAVDANGLLPLAAADRTFPTAYAFRRFLQTELPARLREFPLADPLQGVKLPQLKLEDIEADVTRRWPIASTEALQAGDAFLTRLPLDHQVRPAAMRGGAEAARQRLEAFLKDGFGRYGDDRNHPDHDASSGLSPYLHFGHVGAHEVFSAIAEREDWTADAVEPAKHGKREGWWRMSSHAESFLDELITWRELGYNLCSREADYDKYESLPDWARQTLEEHEDDPRDPCYELEDFEAARTHDEVWNAAQRQLVLEGRMHNYLRMLWGKKILHWSESPRAALEIMIELNNKYAVDGRNPNSYSGIFWCCGRYDRAWGPERPIFGKIRYMTSDSTVKKLQMNEYLERYGERAQKRLF